eukprot:scaffold3069_cov227-Prasinococcus_capsulatus_cf.AAC.2
MAWPPPRGGRHVPRAGGSAGWHPRRGRCGAELRALGRRKPRRTRARRPAPARRHSGEGRRRSRAWVEGAAARASAALTRLNG